MTNTGPTITERAPNQCDGAEAFNSYREWADYARGVTDPVDSQRAAPSERWDFHAGWVGALDLDRNGWPAGTARVLALASRWAAGLAPTIRTPALMMNTEGIDWDLDAVLHGAPEAWVEPRDIEQPPVGVVRVVVNLTTSGSVGAEVYYAKGAASLALAWLLETAGRPVELLAVSRQRQGDTRRQISVRLKEAGAPLDVDRLAVLVAHPAGFRRLMFACFERWTPALRRRLHVVRDGGYGSPVEVEHDEQGDVYVPCTRSDAGVFGTEADTLAWIEAQLRAQGALR